MGEYAAKFRPEIDLDEFERRLRAAAPAPQPEAPPQAARKDDPLAELARLVGGDAANRGRDPFEALFRAQAAIADIRHPQEAHQETYQDSRLDAPQGRAPAAPHAPHEPYFQDSHFQDSQPQRAAPAPAAQPGYAAAQPHYQDAEPRWAEDGYAPAEPAYESAPRAEAPRGDGRKKVFYGMAAVLAVGVIGIGATLGLRGKTGGQEVVTIQADSDPAKVKPAASETASTANSQTLFDRKDTVSNAKVVGGAEQPADLGASAKAARAAAPPPPAAPSSSEAAFPAPKKVKTVQVRADGSVIQPADARPTLARGLPSMATGIPATSGGASNPAAAAHAPAAHAPAAKSTERAAPTAEAALKAPAAKPAKPAATEAAGDNGGFAVQLSGTPSEAEARDAATSLSAKYASALKGRHATFVKAQVGDKTVYRVRVGRLTETAAKDMCTAIKGLGGSCFVAKN